MIRAALLATVLLAGCGDCRCAPRASDLDARVDYRGETFHGQVHVDADGCVGSLQLWRGVGDDQLDMCDRLEIGLGPCTSSEDDAGARTVEPAAGEPPGTLARTTCETTPASVWLDLSSYSLTLSPGGVIAGELRVEGGAVAVLEGEYWE